MALPAADMQCQLIFLVLWLDFKNSLCIFSNQV